ncbi:hypothetical protein Q0Z83_025310 [Actinoplanes sichuanensis]|uniref:Secreted protein n=1 Tax=Actinoplanes sichuanensis TaxID=512349 RepID=A0ABW4A1P0_9ACTN|nr:hypothetical protein [Actinoplanes sichuanensis]BEL04340.1 hypothetical protein Q0Z83_025310 [Actinoplanes sichuanensis]
MSHPRLACALAALLTLAGLLAGFAPSPAAAGPADVTAEPAACVRQTPGPSDPYGHRWTGRTVCNNDAPAPIYQTTNAGSASAQKGWLLSTRSWFLCWKVGGDVGGFNHWYYTVGDTTLPGRSNAWGFVPAIYLPYPDPIPWTPECSFAWVPA